MKGTWTILETHTIKAQKNNFLEISLKSPPESQEVLIGISKGWFTPEGDKRYKSNILFSKEEKEEIVNILKEIK